MNDFDIDPSQGAHAAADLSDAEVEYLAKLALWEYAVRNDRHQWIDFVEEIMSVRDEVHEVIVEVRKERELMAFEAEVLADLDNLEVVQQ